MSIETKFEAGYRLITASGLLSFEEIEANMYATVEAEEFRSNTNSIIDFSKVKLILSMDGLKKIAGAAADLRDKFGKCKWAIVASDSTIVEAARLFKTMSNHSDIEIMVFKEMDDARHWIAD